MLLDALLNIVGEVGVVLEEGPGILLALAELITLIGVPGTGLLHDAAIDTEVDERPLARNALAVQDVELCLLERRRHLVLHDLHARAVADCLGAALEGLDPADVEAHRRVELQCLAAGRGLRRAEHDADLLAQLVDKDAGRVRVAQRARHLAQGLAHEPGLQADVAITHLALDLGAGHKGGDRVDNNEIEGPGAHERVGDLECLLARIGL